jgi:hypothetical protein
MPSRLGICVVLLGLLIALTSCGSDEAKKRDNMLNPGITFLPQIQFRPPNTQAGGEVEVIGVGFAPSTALTAVANDAAAMNLPSQAFGESVTTDPDGSFRTRVKLGPGFPPGRYIVTYSNASGTSRNSATLPVTP